MSINSRVKGAAGEREFAKLVYGWTGLSLQRNLEQVRTVGGFDLIVASESAGPVANSFRNLAVEIKRHSKTTPALIKLWWKQAETQAQVNSLCPILAFRANREAWQVMLPLHLINKNLSQDNSLRNTAIISVESFSMVIRELG